MGRTAILIDGGFYQKRAAILFGRKSAKDRADEVFAYCCRHLHQTDKTTNELYRIFSYDCEPSDKNVYHPLTKSSINLGKTDLYEWNKTFLNSLSHKRKVALRMGELLEGSNYTLLPKVINDLCRGTRDLDSLTEKDFFLDIKQKGVDMRIGLDVASIAQKRLVDQVVLIAGDSDFVPVAKHARREGIDFILDSLWQPIRPSLTRHIDGLCSRTTNPNKMLQKGAKKDPLVASGHQRW
ncbi:MAG: NYN domain-containing protein [Coriobacteriales bacterium]|nr:NYN domain-containing protein [Coriobacteriales bacterium]